MPESTKELSGAELDRVIAERVMGWRRKPNGMMHGKAQEVFVDDRDNTYSITCGCAEDFNPSCDIEAAMEVTERMRELGYRWNAQTPHGKGWEIQCFPDHGAPMGEKFRGLLPEAICRAALAAIGSKPESE